jgi:hypothetical protein
MIEKTNHMSISFRTDFIEELDKEMKESGFDSRPGFIRYVLHNWRKQKK